MNVVSADEAADDQSRGARMLDLGHALEIHPDAPDSDLGPEAKLLQDEDRELPVPFHIYAATFAVARRLDLPIYSDDRFIRVRARQAGFRAFGTAALLDALSERRFIQPGDRSFLRRELRRIGSMGTTPTSEELVAEARQDAFVLTRELARPFLDLVFVKSDIRRAIETLLEFLRVVFAEAPETFEKWLARSVDVLKRPYPLDEVPEQAARLLLFAWRFPPEEDEFFPALAAALGPAVRQLGGLSDPYAPAVKILGDSIVKSGLGGAFRTRATDEFIRQLPASAQVAARRGTSFLGSTSA